MEHGRLAVIGAITSGLGHDLRNAIMPALLRLDTLTASSSLSSEARVQLHEVRASLSFLQGLASGLHLLASDTEELTTVSADTELRRWWHDVQPLVLAATSAGTQVESSVPESLPTVLAPANLLAQVLLALVLHARECMQGSESPQLRLSAAETAGGASLTLEFFAAEWRGKASNGAKNKPSPASVPISSTSGITIENLQRLLAKHGGDLSQVECSPAGGTFRIDLAASKSERSTGSSRSGAPSARVELSDLRQRAVAQLLLAQRGYAEWISTGEATGAAKPTVVVCDAESVQSVIDTFHDDSSANSEPSLIVVGTAPSKPIKAAHVTWIAPTQLGLLASALP